MPTHGRNLGLLVVCLAAVLAGCQGLPPGPTGATPRPEGASSGGYDDTDGDGWLFSRLFGQKPPAAARPVEPPSTTEKAATASSPTSSPMIDPAVRKASAVQPMPEVTASTKPKPPVVYLAEDSDEEEPPLATTKKKEPSPFDWIKFSPEDTYKDIKAALGYGPDKKLARQYFEEGLALYQQKRFKEAAAKFKAAAGRWPDSSLEEDAMFLQAECLFFADDYRKADDTFGNLLKKHENSRHLDKIMIREFSIGRYWDQLHARDPHWPTTYNWSDSTRPRFDTLGNARKAFEMVALNDPTGPLADDALMALANGYFLQTRYEEAADYYDRLRKEHPDSPHLIDAHLLLIKSYQQAYQGPLYDGTPLKKTGLVAEQTVRQFGTQLGEDRERLLELENQVDVEMARRDWAMAEFYEGKKQYGAARFYYQQIVKDHPQSAAARAAEDRLAAIKDYPDKPVNHFKFLTDLFPDGK
ncbi:MAG: outer membrane protein assembly factor BamD [Pirellulales bacterium]|nr:outer membrane protein assembly factor BamD [Pirellulales bacterium]